MLSKEEIESMKIGLWNIRADILKAMQCSLADTSDKKEWQKEINTIDNALKYIDQLESDKQKLIEKLEKDIVNANDNIKHMEEKNILQTIARELAIGMRDYAQEILEIVKGVENENI